MSKFDFKLAIFDLDGVIVDTAKYHYLAWKELAGRLGFFFGEEHNERLKGVSRQRSLEILLEVGGLSEAFTADEKTEMADGKNARYVEYISNLAQDELLPGSRQLLTYLRGEVKIALGSASKNAPLILTRLGIKEMFDIVVDGNSTSKAKPDPEVFMMAALAMGVEPCDCLVFEDAQAGIEAAKAAGMRVVAVGDPKLLTGADMYVRDLAEFHVHKLSMIIGMDGFVDEILHVVDKRRDISRFDRIPTMKSFGERVIRAAGLSTNVEMVPVQVRAGGNAAYLSAALIACGVKITCIGALGDPVHPVYHPITSKAEKVYSLCSPGRNLAFEFDDGKLMVLEPDVFKEITWERIVEKIGPPETIAAMIDRSDLFALLDWSLIFNQNRNMQCIIDEVFPLMQKRPVKPIAFFDLSDPDKRSKEDILEGMRLIGLFERKFRTILGLNEKELYNIAWAFDIARGDLKSTTMEVYRMMGIYCVVAHPVKEACCCIGGEYYRVDGPYCEKPLTTTGAGDNFNSGFCLGQALGLSPIDSLTLGVCASGFFVRNARSATYREVMEAVNILKAIVLS